MIIDTVWRKQLDAGRTAWRESAYCFKLGPTSESGLSSLSDSDFEFGAVFSYVMTYDYGLGLVCLNKRQVEACSNTYVKGFMAVDDLGFTTNSTSSVAYQLNKINYQKSHEKEEKVYESMKFCT